MERAVNSLLPTFLPLLPRWRALSPNVRGAALVTLGALFLTVMAVLVKFLGARLDSFEILFFRLFVGLLFVLPMALKHGRGIYRTTIPFKHFTRGAYGAFANACFYFSITHLVLADAMSLQFSRPLWGIVLAAFVLREAIGWRRGIATLVGFGGLLLITRPFSAGFEPAALIGATGALFGALVVVTVKQLTRSEPTVVIMFYFAFWGAVLSFVPALFVWQWPTWSELALLVATGFVGIMGQWLITLGVKRADTSVVLPFDYLRIVYAMVIGLALFGELPALLSLAGAGVIVASTLYILIREARAKKAAAGA